MKTIKVTIVAFIAGTIAGTGTIALINWMKVEEPVLKDMSGPANQAGSTGWEQDTRQLLARIGEQRAEIERLQSQLQAMTEDPVPEQDIKDDQQEDGRARFEERMEERTDKRINQLVEMYGLNEAQRQLLVEAYRMQREYYQARRRGEDVQPYNFDAALESIMTDEQFARYLEDTQQEIYNRAEMMATTQMVRISQQLALQAEQQDLVYEAIHYTAQEAMIARQRGESFDMRQVLNDRLSSVLSEEQLQELQVAEASDRRRRGGQGGGPRP